MKHSILIVEDEKTLLEYLQLKFQQAGFVVWSATDGVSGLEVALKHKPDIILLDILMPKANGMQMLQELRQDLWGKNVKVVFLTNVADMEKRIEAEKNGVMAYLVKSALKMEDIVNEVKENLKK